MMNNGFKNEHDIVKAINRKQYKDLSNYMKDIIKCIFKNVEDEDYLYARICERTSKPDISIIWKDEISYISIKSGTSDSIHFEKINQFVSFLESKNVSKETIETILLFHYGDGTIDGTGEQRLWFNDLFPMMSKKIQKANCEINKSGVVEELIDRFLFDGIETKRISVDYILFGDKNYGLICGKNNIKKFIFRKSYAYISTLHVGPFTIHPFLRDVNRVSKNIYKREYLQVKWHYMLSDLQYIHKYYELPKYEEVEL